MRVVMISKACVVGQYQKKLEELAKYPDLELTVVVPPLWRDERGVVPLERAHLRGYTLLVEPMRLNGQFHLHYYPTLPKILARVQPDLVHIDEEPYNLATWHALHAARRVRAKTLFFTWQNLLRRYPPPFAWMEADVLRRSDYAIAGNAEAVAVLRAKDYRGAVSVIPQFGIDPDVFAPGRRLETAPTTSQSRRSSADQTDHAGGLRDGVAANSFAHSSQTFRIGSGIGRLVEEKGVDVLFRAAAELDGDWEIWLLGSGPAQTRLEALARELGIAARVHFDLPRPSAEMPEYYAQLDCLVMPSRTRPNWKEQFGRALVEAMACAVPVIGSTCGEIPHVIGDAGLIFREEDAGALRAHLVALRDNPTRRAELGQRGRARVLAQFTQARVAEETYQVYEKICKQAGA
ncbi:MAG: glycosyltransferase [Chloroflexota bacterium]